MNFLTRRGFTDGLIDWSDFSYLMGFEIQHTFSHVCFGGFIYSFSKYLLCTYFEPLTGLAPGDVALTEVDHSPYPNGAWELNP